MILTNFQPFLYQYAHKIKISRLDSIYLNNKLKIDEEMEIILKKSQDFKNFNY